MENNSVLIFKTPSPKSMSTTAYFSGNNPFDDMLKKTLDTATLSEWKNRRPPENLLDIDRNSLSFQDLNASDLGRESMGILPPDFGNDSHGLMNMSFEIGRESLGILQLNAFRDSLSFRRESLGILNLTDFGRESLDCHRESLGILKIKSPDVMFGDEDKKIPDIILTTIENSSDYMCNPLDMAFLSSYSKKSSGTASTGSSITPSFNSVSLEGPSAIYPSFINRRGDYNETDILNKGFVNLDEHSTFSGLYSVCSPLYTADFGTSDVQGRSRIQSLPTSLQKTLEFSNAALDFGLTDKRFWTGDRTVKTATFERRSFHRTLDFDDASDEFHDSVFIEGHHIAEKIADGSILNDSTGNEIGILDCTPQPIWPEDLSYTEKDKEVKCATETVFKTVDKMLPAPTQDIKFKIKTSKTDSTSSNENCSDKSNVSSNSKSSCSSGNDDSKAIQNLSNITRGSDKHCTSRRSCSVSKDAKEILHNLSEILNCTHPSDQQKSEGQNLLSSLADMLCTNNSSVKTNDPDDSGHSSTNEMPDSPKKGHECFEVLDLRTKSTSEDHEDDSANKNGLDLSLPKSKPEKNVGRRLSQSLSSKKSIVNIHKNMSLLGFDANKNRNQSVNSSANSNDSKNITNMSRLSIAGKLRQKSMSNVKKGPMKAVIPVGSMKKGCNVTPERNEQKTSAMQSKRTSTPINEPKLRPVAASTPATEKHRKDGIASPLSRFRKRDGSPMFRRESAGNPSSALPRPLNVDSKVLRRNSVSEFKKAESVCRTKRSNSIENDRAVLSSLAKVRQNIVSSPHYQLKKQNVLKDSNLSVTENKGKSERSKGLPAKAPHSAKSENGCSAPSVADPLFKFSSPKQKSESVHKDRNHNVIATKLPFSTSERAVERRNSSTEIKLLREKSAISALERRNSLSDIKKSIEKPVQRSNSLRKEAGIMSSIAKIRQNILNSPFYSKKKEFANV